MKQLKFGTHLIALLLFCSPLCAQQVPASYNLNQLDSLVNIYYANRDYEQLLPFVQAAMKKVEALSNDQDTFYPKMLAIRGAAYYNLSVWDKAEEDLKKAIEWYKNKRQKSPYLQESLSDLGCLYIETRQDQLAIQYLTEFSKMVKEENGLNSTKYARSLSLLGSAYNGMGLVKEGQAVLKQAIEIYKAHETENPQAYAGTLVNLANVYASMGYYPYAERLYVQAMGVLEKADKTKHPFYLNALNNVALLYSYMDRNEESERCHKKGLALLEEVYGKSHYMYALGLCNLAVLYESTGRYVDAKSLYEEALALQKQTIGVKHADYALTLSNLANFYTERGDYAVAEQMLREVNALRKEILGVEDPEYATGLGVLSRLYKQTKRYSEAESLLKEVLRIYKKTQGPESRQYIRNLFILALLHKEQKQYDIAQALLKELLEGLNASGRTRTKDYIDAVLEQAAIYLEMGEKEMALQYAKQAMELNAGFALSLDADWIKPLKNADYVAINSMVANLKLFYQLATTAAIKNQAAELALHLLKRSRDNFTEESDKLLVLESTSEWVLLNLKALNPRTQAAQAFAIAEQSKSVLLSDAAKNEAAYSFGELPDSLVYEEQYMQRELASLQAALLEEKEKSEKDSLLVLRNKQSLALNQLKKNIERDYPQYAALKYADKQTNVVEIQALLDNKTALLEFVIGDSSIYIFYVDKKQLYLTEYHIHRDSLKTRIKDLHESLSNYELIKRDAKKAYAQFTNNAHWFYEHLLKESLGKTKGINHLIIIPDGELAHLPFETFLLETAPKTPSYTKLHYLIKDYKVSYNYAASLWKENKVATRKKNNGQLFAVAANYEALSDSLRGTNRAAYRSLRDALQALPAARLEVEALQAQYRGFFGFDSLATEREFKNKASQFGIIHLAMHGLLNDKSPILSSLAFTEDGDSVENNFLQAYEISKLKLNADLVVLSACETGYGKFEAGNGTASLARAFMYAGVPAMVVSLWQVNDASTSAIMQLFYENLAKGMDKAEALQQAKLFYIKLVMQQNPDAAHPAYWAPFIQLGDSRPIQILEKGNGMMWWCIGGVALLALGAVLLVLARKNKEV